MNNLTHPSTILIAGDSPRSQELLRAVLADGHEVKLAGDGEGALQTVCRQPAPDLILLSVELADISGYDLCQALKAFYSTAKIPVMLFAGPGEPMVQRRGLALGAIDVIPPTMSMPVTMARIKTHLATQRAQDLLNRQNRALEGRVQLGSRQIAALQDLAMRSMVSLAEMRDIETGNHMRRTAHYVKVLAEQLRGHPRFRDSLSEGAIELLFKSAPLHDLGKIGIPDHILLKPGRFEPEEMEIMKTHATLGRDAILAAEGELGIELDFLQFAKEMAHCHHEKWDGSGYPQGLAGEAIPMSARLMAVADVYDALISRRPYKNGMSHEQAAALIVDGRGSHFDPDMVDAFVVIQENFNSIAAKYADNDGEIEKMALRSLLVAPSLSRFPADKLAA